MVKKKYFKNYGVNVHLGYRIDDFYRERVYVFDEEENRFVPWILDNDLKPHRKIWIIKDIIRKSIVVLNKKDTVSVY